MKRSCFAVTARHLLPRLSPCKHNYRYVFVEYGPMELDINLRVRVDELEKVLVEKVCLVLRAINESLHHGLYACWP